MKSRSEILRGLDSWAEKLERDKKYPMYTSCIEDNLIEKAFCEQAKEEFKNADGSEIKDSRYPAKIKALYSSSALVYNVFEYWRNRDKTSLSNALGIDYEILEISFEKKLNTRISTPNIDVFIKLGNGKFIAIESKYCEWMSTCKYEKFKTKYFTDGAKNVNRWLEAGLSNCQTIANKIQAGNLFYRRIDVLQLLKHALGVANTLGSDSQLIYLYYDLVENSRIRKEHSKEIEDFTKKIDGELNFKAVRYQDFFKSLVESSLEIDASYIKYIRDRYSL